MLCSYGKALCECPTTDQSGLDASQNAVYPANHDARSGLTVLES